VCWNHTKDTPPFVIQPIHNIRLYLRHFHAEHQAHEGKFDFEGNQIVGNIVSANALSLIRQWAQLNRASLDANWSKIQAGQALDRIPPLE
jgi:hypothetical protein